MTDTRRSTRPTSKPVNEYTLGVFRYRLAAFRYRIAAWKWRLRGGKK